VSPEVCVHPSRTEGFCVDCPRAVNSCVQVCPNCDVVLEKTSGGKLQCRRCGFLLTCCD
jgi:NMD protein affecting ribosome stability and mRNA decay